MLYWFCGQSHVLLCSHVNEVTPTKMQSIDSILWKSNIEQDQKIWVFKFNVCKFYALFRAFSIPATTPLRISFSNFLMTLRSIVTMTSWSIFSNSFLIYVGYKVLNSSYCFCLLCRILMKINIFACFMLSPPYFWFFDCSVFPIMSFKPIVMHSLSFNRF